MPVDPVELGLIEGFYGRPWSWAARAQAAATLKPHGYGFYLYAPKADAFLRRRWREPHPQVAALAQLSTACRTQGVRFGVGLSPYELFRDFNAEARAALTDKLAELDAVGVDDLAILFDDMRGDVDGLARGQLEIAAFAAERTRATRVIVCPSYYTDDPVLDRVFGQRPPGYLEDLGAGLDPAVEVMWTGDEVCSREFSPGGLDRVAERIRRRPFLWDNYPVNDGPRMSLHLHLRAFTGRPASIAGHVRAHGINVALQPTLSLIPAITLAMSYAQGRAYRYGAAFRAAADPLLGEPLGARVEADILSLDDAGLGGLSPERRVALRDRYAAFDHDAAREIVDWLDGAYAITGEEVETQ